MAKASRSCSTSFTTIWARKEIILASMAHTLPTAIERHGVPRSISTVRKATGVRRFFIDNALYWLTEYHVDALRLDAIHEIFDFGAYHVLREMAEAFHRQARLLGRDAWLIAESDLNDPRVINSPRIGGHGLDAQWNDDFHHSLHTLLTGARNGYFVDFGRIEDLRKASPMVSSTMAGGRSIVSAAMELRPRRIPAASSWCSTRTTTRLPMRTRDGGSPSYLRSNSRGSRRRS